MRSAAAYHSTPLNVLWFDEFALNECRIKSNIALIGCIMAAGGSVLPPNHLVNHSHVALDYLHDFRADILICVVRNRCAVVAILY